MTKNITVNDRQFKPYLTASEIDAIVDNVASRISADLKGKNPLFCATLTGAFMFMSDLAKKLDFDADICFIKYSSYSGMKTTGKVTTDLPFPEKCRGRHVVIVEDIIDTGITMDAVIGELKRLEPAGICVATLLFKPGSFKKNFKIDYIGRSIPNDFIAGYGMDYNDYGRFYKEIYVVENN